MKVEDLIPHVWPTTKAMCDALSVSKGAISQWRIKGIPELRQYQIRELMRAKELETAA